eukprot:TRINITY_DN7359_c0_g2_i1.p1 TRINITY_DN7359_c0_g2~~TRINITY_DN7359_c0_g2_i1.p1  ORF type:complete len:253 (-),score=17.77 TRINITY_DN7359_c0_g2_i1:36-794(-)
MNDVPGHKKFAKAAPVSFSGAKKELVEFVNKNIAEIMEVQKYAKSFKICLRDEHRSRLNAEEWIHLGTSIQMVVPISEKHLSEIKSFIKLFEEHFEPIVTVYSSGPVYGISPSFSLPYICSGCHCALENSSHFLCPKCDNYSLCVDCYSKIKHQHFLYYVNAESKAVADEVTPRCKKTIHKIAMKICVGCNEKANTKGAVSFVCAICSSLVMCKICFDRAVVLKDEAIKSKCVQAFPHHNFDSHFNISVPLH